MIELLFWQGVLTGAVRSGTSVLFGTVGEIVSEKAGITNLGTEGCMLMGACVGVVVGVQYGPVAGVLAGALAGGGLSLIHAFLVITRQANQMATGLALTFLGLGLTAILGRAYVGVNIKGISVWPVPGLSAIPILGPILFQHDILTYLAYLLGPLVWVILSYTRLGLAVRSVGESPTVAFAYGLSPQRIQYIAVFIGGLLAGLGGAQLSLAYTHTWVEGMTSGRGFIAVALCIFALWKPLRALAGAFLFGGAVALQLQLQTRAVPISSYLLDMFPYLLTLVVLLAWGKAGKRAMPAGLKAVFRDGS